MKNILPSSPHDNGSEHFYVQPKHLSQETKKITLPVLNGLVVAALKDIVRLESDGNYTLFFFKQNKKILLVSKSLCEFSKVLEDYDFCRVHDKHLVNLHYIKQYTRGEGGSITMTDDSHVDVSRRKRDEFLMRLAEI
ncbi:MAG: LytTR family transcriptional regulator [Bacteroidia bacterium]|nr:LytTR family transcriptional regulator [Bacteroidia bacterium]